MGRRFLQDKTKRSRFFLLLYSILMLTLLFGRSVIPEGNYWEQVKGNINWIPFRTIMLYVRLLKRTHSLTFIRLAVVNLIGNVVMFIPLGLLLPKAFDKLQSGWRFFFSVLLGICLIEFVQLFTLVGICDVDDLILNVAGAGIGFLILRVIENYHAN